MKYRPLELEVDLPFLNGEGQDGLGNPAPEPDTIYLSMMTDGHFEAHLFRTEFPGMPYEWTSEDNCWVVLKTASLSGLIRQFLEDDQVDGGGISEEGKRVATALAKSLSSLADELMNAAEGGNPNWQESGNTPKSQIKTAISASPLSLGKTID